MARTLVIMPSVNAVPEGQGYFLDRKAIDGLRLYAKLWPGPVRALFREGIRKQIAFGQSYSVEGLPIEIRMVPEDASREPAAFDDAAVVLAAGDSHLDFSLSDSLGVPVVYIIEYTLRTRMQIIRLECGLSPRGVKTAVWTLMTERKRRRAFRSAAALQCNGVPAYDAYRRLSPDALLYFDTRVANDQQITAPRLASKDSDMLRRAPLRLAFSGRLDPMKGADHLVPIAQLLSRRGIEFTLSIFGDGALRAKIGEQIARAGLGDHVFLRGPVSFEKQLLPAMIADIDLFLCCHRQADPSCTYTETLSCGVPIVGYDNAAFAGIAGRADIGIMVPMNDKAAAADAIALLDADRPRLAELSRNAAAFGRQHSFEKEFESRIDQLKRHAHF